MIKARFQKKGGYIVAVTVSGHAGADEYGKDIVCAAVTSAVQLTANGLTELSSAKAVVKAEGDTVSITVAAPTEQSELLLGSLLLHLTVISDEYKENSKVEVLEV